ncbi:MAG: hypothetical protein ACI9ZF_001576 [Bradyrhizobium sp.]|jgi:hypothetical protein
MGVADQALRTKDKPVTGQGQKSRTQAGPRHMGPGRPEKLTDFLTYPKKCLFNAPLLSSTSKTSAHCQPTLRA